MQRQAETKFTTRPSLTRFARPCAALILCVSALHLHAQQTLPATPTTVVWGYYSAKAKPALTVHSGDTVRIQTLSTCGAPERLESLGVAAADIPAYMAHLQEIRHRQGPRRPHPHRPRRHRRSGARRRPRSPHPVNRHRRPLCLQRFGAGRGFLPDDFPYGRTRIIPLDRAEDDRPLRPRHRHPAASLLRQHGRRPAHPPAYNSAPPWMHAGNMDNKEMVAGTTLFIPVHPRARSSKSATATPDRATARSTSPPWKPSSPARSASSFTKTSISLAPRRNTHSLHQHGLRQDLKTATEMAVRNMIEFLVEQNEHLTYPRRRLHAHQRRLRRRHHPVGRSKT